MRLSAVGFWSASALLAAGGAVASLDSRASRSPERSTVTMAAMADSVFDVVVGDTIDLAMVSADTSFEFVQSSNPDIVTVTATGKLVAKDTGSALITTRSPSLGPAGDTTTVLGGGRGRGGGGLLTIPRTLMKVDVRTRRQAMNMLVSEVCANVDYGYFIANVPISATMRLIHEYHDCQRLIDSAKYYSIVGIYATLRMDARRPATDTTGYLAAVIVNFVGNKDTATYQRLGISPGVNCLIVRSTGRERFQAAIIPQAFPAKNADNTPHYGDCPETLTWQDVPPSRRNKLVVKLQVGAVNLLNRPIAPSVARWDWDRVHRYNYIGVKCGAATWCEIGPDSSFVPSPAARTTAGGQIFKGYYDEQFLASDSTGSTPSSVFGTILPGHDAADSTQMQARDTLKWYEVAVAHLTDTAAVRSPAFGQYASLFSITPGPQPSLRNIPVSGFTVSAIPVSSLPDIIAGPAQLSELPIPSSRRGFSRIFLRPVSRKQWWRGYAGMLNAFPGQTIVHYRFHPNEYGQPTVRWRWKANDESIWGFCQPAGCCEYESLRS